LIRSLVTRNGNASAPQEEIFWALKDISFEIQRGEVVGVIGRNGAGKSTLLKILSRITEPDEGYADIYGRVGSLLEVGTGFHQELTGRENLYLNGAILGMKRAEISRKFDEIVSFAEVDKFIDTPVKHYSSGMYLRLAFAVAAHLDPEILLVDEVLAVGDAQFQKKCLGKMGEVARAGRTVLFVSHNMEAIRRLCRTAFWIHEGHLVEFQSSDRTIADYLASTQSAEEGEYYPQTDGKSAPATARLVRVWLINDRGEVTATVTSNSSFHIAIGYEIRTTQEVRVGFRLLTQDGIVAFSSTDTDPDGWGAPREPGFHVSRCLVPGNLLNTGRYWLTVSCDVPMREILFLAENILPFTVEPIGGVGAALSDNRLGVIRPSLQWHISPGSANEA
jgi:lipopolysaccharide transport system ATP-binding protein